MKKILNSVLAGLCFVLLFFLPTNSFGQNDKLVIKKYLSEIPKVPVSNALQKFRMTAVYTNRDLYGNFTGKTKITGDYTRGLENGYAVWNNVFISNSNDFSQNFPEGIKQDFMENMKYVPSPKMLEADAFRDFPAGLETVFCKNLVWDMMAIEGFAWDYLDSLQLNKNYVVPEIKGEFAMSDIGTYFHTSIQVCWTGISQMNDELYAVIEYRAIDNKLAMELEGFKTKGTEQYWGTTWVSLKTRKIGKAVMYSGTIQEIEIAGMENKFLSKTIRELWVDKIQ
jgi:hypothetical protein